MYDYSILFVVLLGMGIVFSGLVGLIVLTSLTSGVVRKIEAPANSASVPKETAPEAAASAPVSTELDAEHKAKQDIELATKVFAILAEELRIDLRNAKLTITKL